ncbi:hypothetical protein HPB48_013357 [Haemaphysalis longicornis]|uniref:Uncharacterized protein n=1 Tax=Haemaphysalis longicornis TaxID=44386 RepID=A0A9J6FRR4_HAELO|nr:hypothetical protein HPB48_013357 [Haemaphysalis longicornis]
MRREENTEQRSILCSQMKWSSESSWSQNPPPQLTRCPKAGSERRVGARSTPNELRRDAVEPVFRTRSLTPTRPLPERPALLRSRPRRVPARLVWQPSRRRPLPLPFPRTNMAAAGTRGRIVCCTSLPVDRS